MNRAARRQMMRQTTDKSRELLKSYTKQQKIDALLKNGIRMEDLEKEYEEGRKVGFFQAALPIRKACYAAVCLVLHDDFGFDPEQCYKALKALDERTVYCLDNTELVDEVFEKTGIEIDLDDTFDRVRQKDV